MSDHSNNIFITASKLYDYIKCEHRVWRDIHGPEKEKIEEVNPFLKLLWDKGTLHENKIVSSLGEFLDLSAGSLDDRFKQTQEAMKKKTPLIYQGVLIHENLLGIPDILELCEDGSYVAIDIKSGMGYEGGDSDYEDSGRPKKHYAVQLALYTEILEMLGHSDGQKIGKIININGEELVYNLTQPLHTKTKQSFWEFYQEIKENVSNLISNKSSNTPASCSDCKLCHWHDSCLKWIEESDDLTGLFYVGRSKRDVIQQDLGISNIEDILGMDTEAILEKKKKDNSFLKGIGKSTLLSIKQRAAVMKKIKSPVVYGEYKFPEVNNELFFDIEDDPTQEIVYLHGIYLRTPNGERFEYFVAREVSEAAEKQAWVEFWEFIDGLPEDDYAVYYFSSHEKTSFRKMRGKYPDVISEEKLEAFFDSPNSIDLYTNVVLKQTDWPLSSYSLKSIAQYIGFKWRDDTPSGALSIQWFNDYINSGDEEILKRILEYNEDDCKATMVLKDKLKEMFEAN